MPFLDADALKQVRAPWEVKLNGIRHLALPVSAEAVIVFRGQCAGAGMAEQERALHDVLRMAFPRTWANAPLVGWKPDPVPLIMVHPERQAILDDFFAYQAATPRQSLPSRTNGIASRR